MEKETCPCCLGMGRWREYSFGKEVYKTCWKCGGLGYIRKWN